MKHLSAFLLLFVLPLAGAGCHGAQAHGTARDASIALVGTQWRLVAIDNHPLAVPPDGRRAPSLQFDGADARVHGFTGCNNLAGRVTLQRGNRLQFTELVTTKMACIEPTPEAEFLQDLEAVTYYAITGQILEMGPSRRTTTLRFEAVDAP